MNIALTILEKDIEETLGSGAKTPAVGEGRGNLDLRAFPGGGRWGVACGDRRVASADRERFTKPLTAQCSHLASSQITAG
jgi:hypothetical protein